MKNNINIALVLIFNIIFLTVPASGKTQLPGVAGTINSSDYIDNRLVIENNHSISIYDVEKQEMLSTHNFYYSDKYAATGDNYYLLNDEDETEIIVFNIYSPQNKDTIKTTNRLDSEEIEKLLFFSVNEILIKTKNGVYLYNEEDSKIELLFNYNGDLERSKNNYRLFLSDKKVYFINKDNDVITYDLNDNLDFIDFNIVNEHLVYNIPAKGQEPPKLISLNLNTNEIINIKVLDALLKEISISNNEILLFRDGFRGILEKFDHKLNKRGSIKIDDITLIDIIEPIGNNKYVFISTLEYQIYKFSESDGELREFTFFNTMLAGIKASNNNKYLCGMSSYNDNYVKIIDIDEKRVVFQKMLEYDDHQSYNEIFYDEEFGFIFQFKENSIVSVNPNSNNNFEFDITSDEEINSFGYENEKLYMHYNNKIEIIDINTDTRINLFELDFTPRRIYVNDGEIYLDKDVDDANSSLHILDQETEEAVAFYRGNKLLSGLNYTPRISFSENFIFGARDDLYVFQKNDPKNTNRIAIGDVHSAIALNDSIAIVQNGLEDVWKIKIDTSSGSYTILEELDVNLYKYENDGVEFEPYINRMDYNKGQLFYSLSLVCTIESIDTKITSVNFVENNIKNEKDLKELLNKSIIKNVSVFDVQGRLIKDFKECNSCLEKIKGIKGLKLVKVEQESEIKFFKLFE